MKLFFDARYIRTDFHDGISRYSCELGNHIAKEVDITFIIHDVKQLKFLPSDVKYIKIHNPTSPKEIFAALILNHYNPDVVFTPMQTMGSFGRRFKLILTLHDMIYYRNPTPPTQFNPLLRIGWRIFHKTYILQRLILNQADTVVTVSNTSKEDIETARLTKRPIMVIPNAPRDLSQIINSTLKITNEKPRNLVYMGSFMPYKNVETIIAGMEFLPDYKLHLLSRISEQRKDELQKNISKKAHIVFWNGVSDEQYAKMLADNAILVTASLDEGYGLPIAEALQLGIPAVISNIEIFHEVAGDGALFFEAKNPKDFAIKIKQLEDKHLRQSLMTKGKKHIAKFDWSKSAAVLVDVAKNLMKTN
jgi:glycosyltransferase involved in cell wall biosynthesis